MELKAINKGASTRSWAFNSFLPMPGWAFYLMPRLGRALCAIACPRLCQIKGQCLDSEATLLFIPV